MERLVHVVPLGWEKDRAVQPVLEMRAHRVYLLSRTDSPHNLRFIDLVRRGLRDEVEDKEIRLVPIDPRREFESVLLHASRLIIVESEAGSRVHLNMSASGKIAAAAATLAGMYHYGRLGRLYYAAQEDYTVLAGNPRAKFEDNGLSIGYSGTRTLPRFPLYRPKPACVHALATLYEKGPLTLLELMQHLKRAGIEPFNDLPDIKATRKARGQAGEKDLLSWSAKLRRLVLKDLQPAFVRVTPRGDGGKVRVVLQPDGEFQALVSGLVKELRPQNSSMELL
jgi:hypothetical protein